MLNTPRMRIIFKKGILQIDAISKEKRNFDQFDHESRKIASALYKAGLRKNGFVIYMPSEIIKLHIFLTGVWRSNGVCRASYPDDDKGKYFIHAS